MFRVASALVVAVGVTTTFVFAGTADAGTGPGASGNIIPGAAAAQSPFSVGTFDSGQPINVVVPANGVLTPGATIFVLECAAPNGVNPTTINSCDGNTGYAGGTISVNSDGSIDVINTSTNSGISYTVYALPDHVTLGESPSGAPKCGLGAANECVLYIGQGGGSDIGLSAPHFFSQAFQVHADSTDSGTLNPGDGTFPADAAPAITSANSTSLTLGSAGTFTVTATGFPAPTFSETGALPTGVTLTSGGVLAGTPTQSGSFPITLTATNGVGSPANQSFTLNVNGAGTAPAITSAVSTTFTQGSAGTFAVTATGTPAPTFSETGALPTGVTLTSGGVLAGTPAQSGTFPITLTAHNGSGPDATQSFTVTVDAPPTITSANHATFTEGSGGTFTVTATGFPAPTFSETGSLPTGVTLTSGGMLSGTPAQSGTFSITLTATNGVGSPATQSFTLTVDAAPAITSASGTTFTDGGLGNFTVTATGFPAPTFAESGSLPTGVTFSAAGVLSGTPTQDGVFAVAITAANGVGSAATQHFTLTVDAAPAITSVDHALFTEGSAGQFTVTGTGTPASTFSETGSLPSGVTFSAAGMLSGTPTQTGVFAITITATNGIGTAATQAFTLTVRVPPLTVTTTSLSGCTVGSAYSRVLSAAGGKGPYAWSILAGSLPAGISLDPNSGVISGTATVAGHFSFTVEVSDADSTTATKGLSILVTAKFVLPFTLTGPVVGMAPNSHGNGYWLVDSSGDVAPHGAVQSYGSLAGMHLNAPIVGIVSTSDGKGYWLVSADGGIFAFGDAAYLGSLAGMHLNAPIVGMALTSDGNGYWLVSADGGVFAFGDAAYLGSMGGRHLNAPVVGVAPTSDGKGYRLVAADGGVFAFGDAAFYGSLAQTPLNAPVVGMSSTSDGRGYWLVATDGGVFALGDAGFQGSASTIPDSTPIVGITGDPTSAGYWLTGRSGGVYSFDAPFLGAS